MSQSSTIQVIDLHGDAPMRAGLYDYTSPGNDTQGFDLFGLRADHQLLNAEFLRLNFLSSLSGLAGSSMAQATFLALGEHMGLGIYNSCWASGPVVSRSLGGGYYGIHLQLTGSQRLMIDGVSGALPPLTCSLLRYPQGKVIESVINGSDAPLTHICLVFDGVLLQEKFHVNEAELLQVLTSSANPAIDHYVIQQEANTAIEKVGYELVNLSISPFATRLYAEAKALELIACYLQQLSPLADTKTAVQARQTETQKLYMAKQQLERDFQSPPTLDSLGRQVGLNRRKLAEGFKSLFGKSVYEYVLSLRMQKAKSLLSDCRHGHIGFVAGQVGYDHQASFTKAFKQHVGISPSRFIDLQGKPEALPRIACQAKK